MRRVLLDTTVLIRAERSGRPSALFPRLGQSEADVAVAAVSLAEFLVGVELADSAERRTRRLTVYRQILQEVTVVDYTEHIARVHGQLLAHCRKDGQKRGVHDLIVAATAIATAREIVSGDGSAKFGDLPGVMTAIDLEA